MRRIVSVIILTVLSLPGLTGRSIAKSGNPEEIMRDAISRMEYSFFIRDFNGMRASCDAFRQLFNVEVYASLAHYYLAYVDYRLAVGDTNLR